MCASNRIALIGQLGTGKSYVANELSSALNAQVISFGREVYRVAEDALGRSIDKTKPSDRKLLTDVGTHWGRNGEVVDSELEARLSKIWPHKRGYENVWVDALDRRIKEGGYGRNLVLDDLRFPNELSYLIDEGYLVFLVTCSVKTRSARLEMRGDPYAVSIDQHPSEKFPSWISEVSKSKLTVPTIWNDDGNHNGPKGDKLLVKVPQLIQSLKGASTSDILDIEVHKAAWSQTIEDFGRHK